MNEDTKLAAVYADLAAAQAEFKPVVKNCINPAFGMRYADLSAILDAVRPALNDHGFVLSFGIPEEREGMAGSQVVLLHKSGNELRSGALYVRYIVGRNPAQALGSALTYSKRYAISAFLGIATDDDDDGNGAGDGQAPKRAAPKPRPADQMPADSKIAQLEAAAGKGPDAYREACEKILTREERNVFFKSAKHAALKEAAAVAKGIAQFQDKETK